MQTGSRLHRLAALLAGTSLSLATALPPAAFAQDASQSAGGDPPSVAGQLTELRGSVSFHASGQDQWSQATANYPISTGDAVYADRDAHAAIVIQEDRVVLDSSTEFDVAELDQQALVGTEPQGAVFLSLPSMPQGQSVTVNTPRGSVAITSPGRYEIVAGDTQDSTEVSVVEGAAQVTGTGLSLTVGANQTAIIDGTDQFSGRVGPLQQDRFLESELRTARPRPQTASYVPQQCQYMTGAAELSQYGSWQQSTDYGAVWYPNNVASDWQPYRSGHWSYVGAWGWTWVDDAPWGFAPFHYGRWVQVGGRWGWVAVAQGVPVDAYPVYAPAMVSFVDVGGAALAGFAVGAAAGLFASGAIGWFPLGPREPYVPWYHTSNAYFQNINRVNVVNIRNVNITNVRNITINNYENRRFAVVAPRDAIVRSERLSGIARPLPESALAHVRPIAFQQPVRPTAQTPNLSGRAAREYGLRPTPGRVPATGPKITPVAAPGAGAGPAARPALRPNAVPANIHPVPAERPGMNRPGTPNGLRPNEPAAPNRPALPAPGTGPGARPGNGLPGLRNPGAARPQEPATGLGRPLPNGPARPALPPAGPSRPGETAPGTRPGLPAPHPGTSPARPGPVPPSSIERPVRPPEAGPRPGTAPSPAERPGRPTEAGPRPNLTPPSSIERPVRPPEAQPRPAVPLPRPETRPAPAPRPELRPAPGERPDPRPSPAPRPEPRPVTAPRPEIRPAPAPRPEPRPAASEPRAFAPPPPRPMAPPAPHPMAPPPPHPAAPAPHPAAPPPHGKPPQR